MNDYPKDSEIRRRAVAAARAVLPTRRRPLSDSMAELAADQYRRVVDERDAALERVAELELDHAHASRQSASQLAELSGAADEAYARGVRDGRADVHTNDKRLVFRGLRG